MIRLRQRESRARVQKHTHMSSSEEERGGGQGSGSSSSSVRGLKKMKEEQQDYSLKHITVSHYVPCEPKPRNPHAGKVSSHRGVTWR